MSGASAATTQELPVLGGSATAALPRLLAGIAAGPDPDRALAEHHRTHGPLPRATADGIASG